MLGAVEASVFPEEKVRKFERGFQIVV